MKFSSIEKKDLLKGWVAISLAFGIVLSTGNLATTTFLFNILVAGLTVGLAFILHELAHKYFAQKYHCWAEFRSFDLMLIVAIATAFFGFIFAAPGAVVINGHITKKQSGIISMAGPATNIILAILFFIAYYTAQGTLQEILYIGFFINVLLAAFNLLPFSIFDGKKIFAWNKAIWGAMLVISLGLYMLQIIL